MNGRKLGGEHAPATIMTAPSEMAVRFLGSGDAFGSGGRLQACISVHVAGSHVLLDCGATSLVAMRRAEVQPADVDAVLVSHLHGDHFGGLPFLVLDAQFGRRHRPLLVLGPPGIQQRVEEAMEVLFPGSGQTPRAFGLRFVELGDRMPTAVGACVVTAYTVPHASGAAAYALRLECGGKVLGYSGDTEWTEALIEVARDADLFICEAYFFDKAVKNHLSYTTLAEHRGRLSCRRLVLTHLGADMLRRRSEVREEVAEDGLTLVI